MYQALKYEMRREPGDEASINAHKFLTGTSPPPPPYLVLGWLVGADVGGSQYLQPSQLTAHHDRPVELALDVVEPLGGLHHVETHAERVEHFVHVSVCGRDCATVSETIV